MASFLETLMALNRAGMPIGELPPMPGPAAPMPMGPMPVFTPPTFPGPMPEMAPPAPLGGLDQDLINRIAGPAPVQQDPGFLDKLAVALQGFGAGVQGQGPQFIQSINERRERPQREYEARRLRGVEAAEEKRLRQQAEQQRRADIQADRELKVWLEQNKNLSIESRERMRQAFEMRKAAEKARIDAEEQTKKDKAARDNAIRQEAARLRDDFRASKQSVSLAQIMSMATSIVDNTPMSKEDEKIYTRAPSTGTGKGTAASGPALARQFEALKRRFLDAERRRDINLQDRIAAQFPKIMGELEKRGYEVGYDPTYRYPYQLPPAQKGASALGAGTAPNGKLKDPVGIR